MSVEMNQSEKAVMVVRSLLEKSKGLKMVEGQAATGFSYFVGKKRFCKILKTKKGAKIEFNVTLPHDLAKLEGIETISKDMAHKKHLGTMKHLMKSSDDKLIKEVLSKAFKIFAEEIKAVKEVEVDKTSKEA